MTEFEKLRKKIKKFGEEEVIKKELEDLVKECTNRDQRRYCRILVTNTVKMALILDEAEEGNGLNVTAANVGIGVKKLTRWLNEGEEAQDECDDNDMFYDEHDDFIKIQFFREYQINRNKKNKAREDKIDAASEDIKDSEGKLISRGDWKSAKYMLEKKNKEEYADEKEIQNGGLPEGSGMLVVNNYITDESLTTEQKQAALEKQAASSQSLTAIELKKESDKIK